MSDYSKKVITSPNAAKAIGPYSAAVQYGGLIFLSGQLAIDPQSQELIGATATDQTRQCIKNAFALLEAAHSGPEKIIKTTIFLTNMSDFAGVNSVYQELIPQPFPARTTIAVAALPKNALVEIEFIASV